MDMNDMTTSMSVATSTSTMPMPMSMSMSMTTSMAMATSTGSSMSGMSSPMSMSMSMSTMAMTFFTSTNTPLFSTTWTPANKGQYAGTCIFLIALSVILRVLIAIRPIFEGRLWTDGVQNDMLHTHLDAGHASATKPVSGMRLSLQELQNRWGRWMVSPAVGRATVEVVIAGVGYLLMLAVMTMNVGYFLSVLGGIWLGTFIMGSVAAQSSWVHH